MATWSVVPNFAKWVKQMSEPLHGRLSWRLLPVLIGMLFAQGRRTYASALRGNGLSLDFKQFYYFLGSLGRVVGPVASRLLRLLAANLPLGDRLLFALDDTATKRYGPHVEGAGIHHNPTPGPADQKFLFGHVWVTVSWILVHPLWGVLGLPLRAMLYLRKKDLPKLDPDLRKQFPFQTKLQLAGQLVHWLVDWLKFLGKPIWIVADGGYAKLAFISAARKAGVILVSRLRKDAALRSVPQAPRPGEPKRRGRKPKYGKKRISLAKRAGSKKGWQQASFTLYGKCMVKTFKTFLATYAPADGLIRVVLVKETDSWVAFFCTNPDATVEEILTAVADRAVIEQNFHDIKEVHGAGQQQVRHIFANLAVFNLTLWLHTLIELWAWDQPAKKLRDRRTSPWDNPDRRPSHADRRNSLRRQCIQHTFSPRWGLRRLKGKSARLVKALLQMVA